MTEKIRKISARLCLIAALLSVFGMFLCLGARSARADETADMPTVYAADVSVTQGSGTYIYVYAKNFVSVAGLDIFVRYDSSAFTLGSASKGSFISGAVGEVNAETAGEINLSFVAADGLSGGGLLLTIRLYAKSDAEVKEYPAEIIAGDCYGADLNPIAINAGGCKIKVNAKKQITETVTFYASYGGGTKRLGDEVSVSFYTYNSHGFASADFEINYDDEMLGLKSVSLGDKLKNAESATFSVNEKTKGYIKISYAALSAAPANVTAVNVSFTVIGDKDGQTQIEFISSGLYDANLTAYNGCKVSAAVKTEAVPPVITYPEFSLRIAKIASELELEIFAEKNTRIAAGDFFVSFDQTAYQCVEIVKTLDKSMVVGNVAFKTGVARLSFIYEDGITEDTVLVRLRFKFLARCGAEAEFGLSGSKITDKDFKEQTVGYKGVKVAVSHDLVHHTAKEATCTECGYNEYDECSRCDYTTYKEIPAKGHTEVSVVDKLPSFGEEGLKHTECKVCGEVLETFATPALTFDTIAVRHNCSFGNDLSLLYAIPVSNLENCSDIALTVEKDYFLQNGKVEKEVKTLLPTEYKIGGTLYYRFDYKEVGAKEIGDALTATLTFKKGGESFGGEVDVYSLKEYAAERLAASTDDSFKSLLVELLNYGAAAQVYFNYRTDSLVNDVLTDEQRALSKDTYEEIKKITSDDDGNSYEAQITRKNVKFGNRIELLVATSLNKSSNLDGVKLKVVYLSVDGRQKETFVDGSEFVFRTDVNGYTAYFGELKASELRSIFELTLVRGEEEISATVKYSLDVYASNRLESSTNENFKKLLKQTLIYSDSAKKHFEKT